MRHVTSGYKSKRKPYHIWQNKRMVVTLGSGKGTNELNLTHPQRSKEKERYIYIYLLPMPWYKTYYCILFICPLVEAGFQHQPQALYTQHPRDVAPFPLVHTCTTPPLPARVRDH